MTHADDIKEYWTSSIGHHVVLKVTLRRTGAYDYYSGRIVTVSDWIPTLVLIEIDGTKFWTEAHEYTVTTSTRTYEIAVDNGGEIMRSIRQGGWDE